ncbi:MAG: ABC transporter ATP-binding protein [Coriobacteriia bacterium]|nr:ABC transporter ATP-binding protein [Coriobacteriia bacterium]
MPPKSRRKPPHGHGPGAPGEKPADFTGSVAKTARFLARWKWQLLLVAVFALGSTLFNVVGPLVLATATTALFEGAVELVNGTGAIDFDVIGASLALTMALYGASSACSFAQGWIMSGVTQKACLELRNAIVAKVNRMPFGYFERNAIGDTLSRITNDVDTLGQSLNQGLTQLVTSTVTVVGVILMMLSINLVMTGVSLLIVPVSVVLVAVLVKRGQRYFVAQQEVLGQIDGMMEETFAGQPVVRAFGAEQRVVGEFDRTNDQLYQAAWKSSFISGLMKPLMDFAGNLGYVVVAILGCIFAAQGVITVGHIQAFIQYEKNLIHPLSQLTQVANVLQSMAAAAERVFAFLEQPEEAAEQPSAQAGEIDGSVDFDHVTFGYDPANPVIRDFSARVEPGQTVALVGPTGAGKTTMVKLLMRFYDVDQGAIRMGGRDLREFSRADVRSSFGMVLQDTWLFGGTIRENIRYGRLDATDDQVEAAARSARAHHFIKTLPGGYDFVINEDATNISQGQRQLLTIARAILADRRMLILDEATSSVDTRTEGLIQDAMDALMEGRTSFVIAHRLSTIRNADLILVVDAGNIVEQGTHEELLELGGFYAQLYNSQFMDCKDEPL